jgi:TRAP transporter TAXI family solute receptor
MTRLIRSIAAATLGAALELAFALVLATAAQGARAQAAVGDRFGDKLIQLGAGPPGGSFLPISTTLCEALNARRRVELVRCVPLSSAGSVFNIHAVANGTLQMGLAQEDLVARYAGEQQDGGGRALRTVALLHPTPIAVMVRRAAGIGELAGLRRGVVNKGFRGSGIHANSTLLLDALGIAEGELKGVTFLPPEEFEPAFCEGRIDVVIDALAQPSALFGRLRACGGEFLDIGPEVMARMLARNPLLRPMQIEAGLYDAQQRAVSTLGVRTLLFTSEAVDEEAVYRVARQLLRGFDALVAQQPYLAGARALRPQDVGTLAVPLHRGAARALQELAR